MNRPPYLLSLHRPFHQQLKAARWVCEFLSKRKIRSSQINIEFYFYLIVKIEKGYKQNKIKTLNGLPSKNSILSIKSYFNKKSKKEKLILLQESLNSTERNEIQKHIYSSYKAASYYVNMAKDKLKLISESNELSEKGKSLLKIKSNNSFLLNKNEKFFMYERILEVDFLLFVSLCIFKKLNKKYNLDDIEGVQSLFLEKYYGIRHFNFTILSRDNYNTVRTSWLNALGVLDTSQRIRKNYQSVIESNLKYNDWHKELLNNIKQFEDITLRNIKKYFEKRELIEYGYQLKLAEGKGDLGFVNLYDLKPKLRMSFSSFEVFLNDYYEKEKGKKYIYFSNTVNSIDRRKRFLVRGIPVLKIKIK